MVILALAITVGAAAVLLWPLAPWPWSLAVLLTVAVAARVPRWRAVVALSLLSALWCAVVTYAGLSARVSAPVRATVEGCVVSPVLLDGDRIRFELDTSKLGGKPVRKRLRLSWYEGVLVPAQGECWRLAVKLRPPRGLLNHLADDPQRRAFIRGIHGSGYVDGVSQRLDDDRRWRARWLRVRLGVAKRVRFLAGEGRGHALYVALSVGLRHGLDATTWRVFESTGTGHLVAISGLHVGIVAMLGFGFGRWLVGPIYGLCGAGRRLTDGQIGWAMALVAALVYAALAGFSLPTRRALIMVAVLGVSSMCRVRIATLDSLAAALALVLIMSPLSVVHAGTWLSFGAVAVLLTLGLRPAGHPMAAQAVVFAGLLPVLATFIGRVSLAGPLANAVCVPLFSLLVVPLTLLAVALSWPAPSFAMAMFGWLDVVVGHAWRWLEGLAALPVAAWTLPSAGSWRVALALLALGLGLTVARSVRSRVVVLAACLPLALARIERPAHGDFTLEVFDVGQALAVAIHTRRHVLLYDTGARWRSTDAGAAVVVPQLRAAGVRALSQVIISHADMDHRGGLTSVLDAYPDARVVAGEVWRDPLDPSPPVSRCRAGQNWTYDGVRFSIVHPPPDSRWEGNDASCVLRVDGRAGSALVTGDIEALAELSMLYGARLQPVDVVVGQHHGSASSSSMAFVTAAAARTAVFSTGYDNRWSLPAPAVVTRWRAMGTDVFHTARDGGVRIEVTGHAHSYTVTTARAARPAWWRG